MNKKTSINQEFDHFSKFAEEWWDPEGKYKILHQILPIRMEFILSNIDRKKINKLNILDLGCGGGLTCEPLARLGAKVTGVDFVKKNIEVAKKHAINSKLNINYLIGDISSINLKETYDVILLFEVLEHLDNWDLLIKKIKKQLNPKGKLILSTINKTHFANFFGIFIAENILKWVPKNTHNYNKLIKPETLKKELINNNFKIINTVGMNFNPISREWKLNNNLLPINYFCSAELN